MGTLYRRGILNNPEVQLRFSSPLVGMLEPGDVTLEVDNGDRFFNNKDLRGKTVDYWRWDGISHEQWYELSGRVVSQTLKTDRIILKCKTYDLDAFQTKLPRNVVTAATFSLADPQQGLGRPIPIPWGICNSTNEVNDAWELPWVGDTAGAYDYLLGPGTYTNVAVFRDAVGDKLFLVPGSEYGVNTSAYPGYSVVRFTLRQRNFSGGFHRIFAVADITGADRNFANFIKYLINDATHGLGLAVNTSSFSTAAAALPIGLYCDGVVGEQMTAVDVIRQLLMVWGMVLKLNSDGEYTLTVDTMQSTVKGVFGHGVGQQYGGIMEFDGLSTTPVSEAVKSLIVDYRRDRRTNQFVLSTSARSVLPVGAEKRIEMDFVRDKTTADKIACRMAKALYYGDARLPLNVGQTGRTLFPGDVIRYHSIAPDFTQYFKIQEVNRGLTESRNEAVGWSSDIYTYTAGTLPSEPASATETDYTRQTPTVASSLSVTSSGIETSDQGVKTAYMVLQYTVPDESWARTVVKYTKDGETLWTSLPGENGSGVKTTKIAGLVGSQVYDLRVTRENLMNATLAANADLANQTAPGDTTPPGTPGTPTIVGQHLKNITFKWDASSGGDVDYYDGEVRTASGGGGSQVKTARSGAAKTSLTIDAASFGTTYYFRVCATDHSGNTGTWSSDRSFSMSRAVTDDVSDGNITTVKVADGNITTGKRQAVNTQSLQQSCASGTSTLFTFTVGTGSTNMVTARVVSIDPSNNVSMWIRLSSSTSVSVLVWNHHTSSVTVDIAIDYW